MSSGKYTGLKCLVRIARIDHQGNTFVIAGQRDATLNIETSEIDITSKDSSGGWEEVIAGNRSWNIDCSGAHVLEDASIGILEEAMIAPEHTQATGMLRALVEMPSGENYTGQVLVTSFSIAMPHADLTTYSLTLRGTGPLTKGEGVSVATFSGNQLNIPTRAMNQTEEKK